VKVPERCGTCPYLTSFQPGGPPKLYYRLQAPVHQPGPGDGGQKGAAAAARQRGGGGQRDERDGRREAGQFSSLI
jgi:hypothetical protein